MNTYKAKIEFIGKAGVELREFTVEGASLSEAIVAIETKMNDLTAYSYDIKNIESIRGTAKNPAQEGIDAARAEARSQKRFEGQLSRFVDFIRDSQKDQGRVFEGYKESVEFLKSGMEFFYEMEMEGEDE